MNYNYLTPSCEILVNGQKRKLYGKNKNKIYLNDGDEFQLKVYNPLSERVGFQLKMNGSETDNSILVLNPGQSVIVERFIGTNRKLKFNTYLVDKNNPLTKQAIKGNGKLEVIFWNESKLNGMNTWTNGPIIINNPPYVPPVSPWPTPWPGTTPYTPPSWPIYYCGDPLYDQQINVCDQGKNWGSVNSPNSPNIGSAGLSSDSTNVNGKYTTNLNNNINLKGNVDINGDLNVRGNLKFNGLLSESLSETGRIEKGKKSNQHFSETEFTCGSIIKTYCFKLLPFSEKKNDNVPFQSAPYQSGPFKLQDNPYIIPNANFNNTSYVKTQGREYCPNKRCGYRVRNKNYGWCPMCGTRLD